MTRTQKVLLLLSTLFDYLPTPRAQTFGGLSGPAPSTSRPCGACNGAGTFGKKRRACEACRGAGTVKVDAYTGEPVGTKGQRVTVSDSRRIDSELRRLAADEAVRRGKTLDDPFAWEANRIRYRRAGSYAALERALESLRANEPDLCSLVMRCVVYGVVDPGPAAQAEIDRAVEWLSRRLPPDLRVPRWVVEQGVTPKREWPADRRASPARAERNAQMIAMGQEGVSRAEIAQRFGVSAATVSRVLSSVTLAGTAA